MKAITIHQPWATLIMDGRKTEETRSFCPIPRVPFTIAIHAGKYRTDYGNLPAEIQAVFSADDIDALPYGAILGTARIHALSKVHRYSPDGQSIICHRTSTNYHVDPQFDTVTLAIPPFGDATPGRYLWHLDTLKPVEPPIPCRGYQGIWNLKRYLSERILACQKN